MGALALLMGKDLEKEIPDFEIERKLNFLMGEYATYKGINKISVVKKGPMLYDESRIGGRDTVYPLIPEIYRIENYRFYTISGLGKKMAIEFVLQLSGKIVLYIERNHSTNLDSKHCNYMTVQTPLRNILVKGPSSIFSFFEIPNFLINFKDIYPV